MRLDQSQLFIVQLEWIFFIHSWNSIALATYGYVG
jgi:hypothetical protein